MRKIDTIAHRIRIVRKEHNLTSEQFAERIMCNKRTIQRYENGDSLPDIYNLKRISIEFGVSTDYLLGLSDQMDTTYHAEEIALLYKKYKQMMLNPIKKGEDYYWIRMEVKEDKTYITSLQTEWVGFADEDANNIKEIKLQGIILLQIRVIIKHLYTGRSV